jgi:hypothetical protein
VEGERVVLDLLEVWEGTANDPVSILAVETFVDDAYRRFPGLRVTLDPWQAEGSYQKLHCAGRRIEKFTFSPKSIHGLSTTLYQCVQDETLRVFDDRELEHEVLSLQTRETPEGWRFDHRRGDYSDRVVALAMALQAAVKMRTATQPLRVSTGWKARARADAERTRVPRPDVPQSRRDTTGPVVSGLTPLLQAMSGREPMRLGQGWKRRLARGVPEREGRIPEPDIPTPEDPESARRGGLPVLSSWEWQNLRPSRRR